MTIKDNKRLLEEKRIAEQQVPILKEKSFNLKLSGSEVYHTITHKDHAVS